MEEKERSAVLPVLEEELRVDKRLVETGRVRVRTLTKQREELVAQELATENVEVELVPIGREVDFIPKLRQEGDVTIVPIVEEVLVVEKRLVLKEEVHIRRTTSVEHVEIPVVLRTQDVLVERLDADGNPTASKETNS